MLPFFAIFFGIMYSDMGYGLLLLLVGLIKKLKAKPRGTMKYFAGLSIICGTSTFIIGALTGSFFGDSVTVVSKMFGKAVKLWFLIDPSLTR
jgi:V/A-type H+-transporting ATPase subunit I